MGHNLMLGKNGIHAYAGAKDLAWHRLGVTTDNIMTAKEAIELAQLGYNVGIQKLYADIPVFINGERTENINKTPVNTHNVTFNTQTGRIFGVVGQRYEVVQNYEAFDFLDEIVGQGEAAFHTAGALGFGETIFISVKLPQNIRLKSNPNEEIQSYMLFTSSHDGTGSIKVGFTPIRVVCNNTLTAALNGMKTSFTIKHTKNVRNKLKDIQNLFMAVNESMEIIGNIFDRLNKVVLTDLEINSVLAKLVLSKDEYIIENGLVTLTSELQTRKSNLIYQLTKSVYQGVGQDLLNPNTAYGVYNGVTNYLQNSKEYKSEEDKFKDLYNKSNLSNIVFKDLLTLI